MISIIVLSGAFFLVWIVFSTLDRQAGDVPWPEEFWPSKWGPDDERGSFNTVTPEKVKAALKLARTGKVYRLGLALEADMPRFEDETFSLTVAKVPSGGPQGRAGMVWNDEFISGHVGQVGTHLDGPGHVGIVGPDGQARWYNGRALARLDNAQGLARNGVENLGPIVTRGVLINLVDLKGRPWRQGEVITPADIKAATAKAGIEPISSGDAVIFRTGWLDHWLEPETYMAGCPGIGLEAAEYLIDRDVALVGADTWTVEVIPEEDPNRPFICHQLMQTVHGIWFLENVNPVEPARDRVYQFAFFLAPIPFKGATGSPCDPVALA